MGVECGLLLTSVEAVRGGTNLHVWPRRCSFIGGSGKRGFRLYKNCSLDLMTCLPRRRFSDHIVFLSRNPSNRETLLPVGHLALLPSPAHVPTQ